MWYRAMCVLAGAAASSSAQSAAFAAINPATFTASLGSTQVTGTIPAGAMLPSGFAGAALPSPAQTGASLTWSQGGQSTGIVCSMQVEMLAVTPGSQAAMAPADFLVQLALPVGRPVRIDLRCAISGPAGTAMPLVRADVGNDGSFELIETQAQSAAYAQLGPAGLPVRVQLGGSLNVQGRLVATLVLSVVPDTHTTVTTVLSGCAPETLTQLPTFDGGLLFRVDPPGPIPPLPPLCTMVFGFGWQPLLLGGTPANPCLLLPSIDATFNVFLSGPYTLPLPPAVRPITFYSQAAVIDFVNPIRVTSAQRVNAW